MRRPPGRHEITSIHLDGDFADPGCFRALELATDALTEAEDQLVRLEREREEQKYNAPCEGPSIDTVLTEFLADRRDTCSPRTFGKAVPGRRDYRAWAFIASRTVSRSVAALWSGTPSWMWFMT